MGEEDYNYDLSLRRARAAVDYLASRVAFFSGSTPLSQDQRPERISADLLMRSLTCVMPTFLLPDTLIQWARRTTTTTYPSAGLERPSTT